MRRMLNYTRNIAICFDHFSHPHAHRIGITIKDKLESKTFYKQFYHSEENRGRIKKMF